MTDYVLTEHARTVLSERSIDEKWVAGILRHPEREEPDRENPELKHALGHIPEHDGRVLRVVYNASTQPVRVVTAFFDRTQRNKL